MSRFLRHGFVLPIMVPKSSRLRSETTKEEKHIRESVKQLQIPCFQTSLHEQTAFSHMFRFKVAIDELSSRETNGLEAAMENAGNYANEVVATLRKAREKGSAA